MVHICPNIHHSYLLFLYYQFSHLFRLRNFLSVLVFIAAPPPPPKPMWKMHTSPKKVTLRIPSSLSKVLYIYQLYPPEIGHCANVESTKPIHIHQTRHYERLRTSRMTHNQTAFNPVTLALRTRDTGVENAARNDQIKLI